MPIDDMGPEKEVVMPEVLARIAGSFRGTAYDSKKLLREILLSDVYRRQIRLGESEVFASSAQPTRLQADTLWHSLVAAARPHRRRVRRRRQGLWHGPVRRTFWRPRRRLQT